MKAMRVRFEILVEDKGSGELHVEAVQNGYVLEDSTVRFDEISVTEVMVGAKRILLPPPDNILPFRPKK